MSSSASSPLGSSTWGWNAALVPSSMSESSTPTTSPAASLVTKTRSITRIRPLWTSSASAGATSPLNWLPGNPTTRISTGPMLMPSLLVAAPLWSARPYLAPSSRVARPAKIAGLRVREIAWTARTTKSCGNATPPGGSASSPAGADPEYEDQILPLVARHLGDARRILDIGCGEGQVARHLAGLGVEVTGIDPTASQVGAARARGGGPRYAQGARRRAPLPDGSVRCRPPVPGDRARRRVRDRHRRGRPARWSPAAASCSCCAIRCCRRRGAAGSTTADRRRALLAGRRVPARRHRRRRGRARCVAALHPSSVEPLRAHAGRAGLLIDGMEEPAPPPRLLAELWDYDEATAIPRVLLVRARRVPR